MSTRGPIEAVSGDSTDTSIYIEQEGAYVRVSMQWTDEARHDVLLTPDLAEAMSYALSEEGKNARGFAQ